ncbi:hypothetical protein CY34DRAFT_9619 [Suillus luteus UH-Slu-Lm8-n1]|uniref:Uncharacterized protein n=1 Tax=Suillus luteus UH-Slu-Lm8-n1 TaxID=930992 RepID=A0A0D0BKJ5_9AGAM|nr:hypothetical protein CY34DRAFT_9619 [Suillus luteus UH-Slu-Lm8-n1]
MPSVSPYYSRLDDRRPSSRPVEQPTQRQAVSQPDIPLDQQCGCAHPALTTALAQMLGRDGVYIQPTVNARTVAQYAMTSSLATPPSTDTIQASRTFPPQDIRMVHTHASYSAQPIPELISNENGDWTLTLNVPIPQDKVHPTLTSFSYTIKYSTANDHWASVVQSNILLATTESEAIPEGISTRLNTNGNYRGGITVVPQTREGADTMCLSSVLAIKRNDLQGQWNHFVDCQQIILDVRIVQSSHLYLQFHVSEYPTSVMLRSLSVDVSATWLDDQEGRRLLHELHEYEIQANDAEAQASAEKRARKVAETQQAINELAEEEAKKRQRAAERQLAVDARARNEAVAQADKASLERQVAEARAEAEKRAREEVESRLHTGKEGQRIADASVQAKIKSTVNRLAEDRNCSAGYVWLQEARGFRCGAGGHIISWEELNAA